MKTCKTCSRYEPLVVLPDANANAVTTWPAERGVFVIGACPIHQLVHEDGGCDEWDEAEEQQ